MNPQIYLIRHGETAWSLTGQHTGRTDLELTPNGEKRASQLAELLRDQHFDHVLTSPLQRARRTCELAGFASGAESVTDLVEWDYGAYEGLTTAEIHNRQPLWNVFTHGAPEGESVEHVTQRADQVVTRLLQLEGTVAVFSHGHFLRALAARWIGLPIIHGRNFMLGTGSVSTLGYEHPSRTIPVIFTWNGAGDSSTPPQH